MKNILLLFFIFSVISIQKISAQDAPVTTIGSAVSTGSTSGSIPVTATFSSSTNVSDISLRITYDPLIATATGVTKGGALPGGTFNFSVATPGLITISWAKGVNIALHDIKILFNITFIRIDFGTTQVTFDNVSGSGHACEYADITPTILNDEPTTTYYFSGTLTFQEDAPQTEAPILTGCPGGTVSVPITVEDFNTIGEVALKLNYNTDVLTYQEAVINAALVGLIEVDGISSPGNILIAGQPGNVTLSGGATIFTLLFTYLGGSTNLTWIDNGLSCNYKNQDGDILPDTPLEDYYENGLVEPGLTQWLGTTSSNWSTASNWSCDVANSSTDLIIGTSPNYPVISTTGIIVNSLTINAGSVTINPNADLAVINDIDNNVGESGILIKSDINGTGSLLHNSDNVDGTIERYITGSNDLDAMMYHLVSVPLTSASSITSNVFLESYLYDFTESTNSWFNIGQSTSTLLDETRGYMIYYPESSHTYSFSGPMNNGSFTALTTYTEENGYNLVPNPYPSAIDWNARGWTKTNIGSTIYFWPAGQEAETSNYATWNYSGTFTNNGTQFIPVGQAFFVQATDESPVLSITNETRVNNAHSFWKSGEGLPNVLRIKSVVMKNNANDELVIAFREGSTPGFDREYDGNKLQGGSNAPQISSIAEGGRKLCINSLPLITGKVDIPLNFTFSSTSNVTFTAIGMDSFDKNVPIYLEDLTLNKMVNLRQNPVYTYIYDPANSPNRFMLHFAGTISIEDRSAREGKTFISNGNIFIDVPGMEGQNTEISVYNSIGQLLSNDIVIMKGIVRINAPQKPGILVIHITSPNQHYCTKILNK
jgi:hypothetical protein